MTEAVPARQQRSVQAKIEEWLQKGGYPLEFQTASIVRQLGHRPIQGMHVNTGEKQREIDVYYSTMGGVRGGSDAISGRVIECKMSSDRPWVMFCSWDFKMTPEMKVAQLIASESGDAALWLARHNEAVSHLPLFEDTGIPAFGMTRAFGGADKGSPDMCYQAVQSVIGNTVAKAREYARPNPQAGPGKVFVGFPLIVIDAPLFRAYFNESRQELELDEIEQGRLYWRGSNDWAHPVIVDVVTIGSLHAYLSAREDAEVILRKALASAWITIRDALTAKSVPPHTWEEMMSLEGTGRSTRPWIMEQLQQRMQQNS